MLMSHHMLPNTNSMPTQGTHCTAPAYLVSLPVPSHHVSKLGSDRLILASLACSLMFLRDQATSECHPTLPIFLSRFRIFETRNLPHNWHCPATSLAVACLSPLSYEIQTRQIVPNYGSLWYCVPRTLCSLWLARAPLHTHSICYQHSLPRAHLCCLIHLWHLGLPEALSSSHACLGT